MLESELSSTTSLGRDQEVTGCASETIEEVWQLTALHFAQGSFKV